MAGASFSNIGWEGGELVLVKDPRAAATLRVVEKETEYQSK